MALKDSRGHSLIELIIYCALSVCALGILTSLVIVARRTGDQVYAQYLVAGNMATTIRTIRKELEATALASVTSYGNNRLDPAGFSCVSAYDSNGEFQLGSYGTPYWQKHVYYMLDKEGKITRWTSDIAKKDYLPVLAPPPTTPGDAARVLMHDALPPGRAVGNWQPATNFGGLEVGFVRREGAEDTIAYHNPRDFADTATNTRLVQVVLRSLEESGPNFMEVKFRVCPRY